MSLFMPSAGMVMPSSDFGANRFASASSKALTRKTPLAPAPVTATRTSLPRFATVKKFTILPAEFSEGAGEVTPSQKLKRKVIEVRYKDVLDAMYAGANGAARE